MKFIFNFSRRLFKASLLLILFTVSAQARPLKEASDVWCNEAMEGSKTDPESKQKQISALKIPPRASMEEQLQARINGDLAAHFIRIKSSGAIDQLDFSETDLIEIIKSDQWDSKQRERFSNVLKRTAELAENSHLLTQNDAFEQALKELGYWSEYIKGCK
ncbi:MAG: hypothetical protein H7333_11700 [Bdellovibrionales bacterium]|nr:hypothetical protein [Oligoflexia bacterium]